MIALALALYLLTALTVAAVALYRPRVVVTTWGGESYRGTRVLSARRVVVLTDVEELGAQVPVSGRLEIPFRSVELIQRPAASQPPVADELESRRAA